MMMLEKLFKKTEQATGQFADLRRRAIFATEGLNPLPEGVDRADARSTAMKAQGENLPRISFGL
jgi:hypothetical protein